MVGWIRAVGSLVRLGELSKILEMLWNRKEGKGKKDFLKGGGGQAELRGGCLKKGRLEPSYELWMFVKLQKQSFSEHIHFAAAALSLNIIPLYRLDVFITILLHTERFILYFCKLFEMK